MVRSEHILFKNDVIQKVCFFHTLNIGILLLLSEEMKQKVCFVSHSCL